MPSILIQGRLFDLSTPRVMGILNVTCDSFVAESRVAGADEVRRKASQLVSEGADLLDLGAYSSRPGADDIPMEEEVEPIKKGDRALAGPIFPDIPISIDTFRTEIARRAIDQGMDIINDISGGSDNGMFSLVASHRIPYILMHMQGNPQTMQTAPSYTDVVSEVNLYLAQRIRQLRDLGVHDIIADVGFGFGKTLEQNYSLLRELRQFRALSVPLLVGISRKSMINRVLDIRPQAALNGTSILHAFALERGASVLRVHDVCEAVEAVKLFRALRAN